MPVDLAELQASSQRVSARGSDRRGRVRAVEHRHRRGADTAVAVGDTPAGHPPGWYHADAETLRYWDGQQWTDWTATWNGARWVQEGPTQAG